MIVRIGNTRVGRGEWGRQRVGAAWRRQDPLSVAAVALGAFRGRRASGLPALRACRGFRPAPPRLNPLRTRSNNDAPHEPESTRSGGGL